MQILEDALLARVFPRLPMLGKKGLILPDESNPQDVARFLKEIGRPETVEGYERGEFQPPEGLPWDPEAEKWVPPEDIDN